LCQALDASWIDAFRAVGYYQHLLVLSDQLMGRGKSVETIVLAAFMFPVWAEGEGLAVLDAFEALWPEIKRVEEVAADLGLWDTVPSRVFVADISAEQLRATFRLCDPTEAELLRGGRSRYPTKAVQMACARLVADLAGPSYPYDPRDAGQLKDLLRERQRLSTKGRKQ
jgi:hypothetical protein